MHIQLVQGHKTSTTNRRRWFKNPRKWIRQAQPKPDT